MYEYRCRACGTEFERYVPGAAAPVACPACQGREITRQLSVFGLRTPGGLAPSAGGGGGACCSGGCSCH